MSAKLTTVFAAEVLARLPTVAADASAQRGALSQLAAAQGCIGDGAALCAPGRALRDPRSATVSREGKHVYVTAQQSKALAVLQRQR